MLAELSRSIKCKSVFYFLISIYRPELVRPSVGKHPTGIGQGTSGTSVIQASPNYSSSTTTPSQASVILTMTDHSVAVPVSNQHQVNASAVPQTLRVHTAAGAGTETVIQDGREIFTVDAQGTLTPIGASTGVGVVDHLSTVQHQQSQLPHHSTTVVPTMINQVVDTQTVTVTSLPPHSGAPILLEKALTSSASSSTMAVKTEPDVEPRDLSRFHPVDKMGFSKGNAFSSSSATDSETVMYGGQRVEISNKNLSEHSITSGHSKMVSSSKNENSSNNHHNHQSLPSALINSQSGRKVIGNIRADSIEIKTEDGEGIAPSLLETPAGGTVVLTSESRLPGTIFVNQTNNGEGNNNGNVQHSWNEQEGAPVYHWSRLVPLITADSNSSDTKEEFEEKPTINGDVIVNGQERDDDFAKQEILDDLTPDRKESFGQDLDFDIAADDDDVFISEYENNMSLSNKRRTQSLGALPGKDDPKSPRKVSYFICKK